MRTIGIAALAALLGLGWGRATEQHAVGSLAVQADAAGRSVAAKMAVDDATTFAGRPRLNLFRVLPQLWLGEPWRADDAAVAPTHRRVFFANRNGALLAGDLWGPADGQCTSTRRCAGVVITEGGSQASAYQYRWAAAALAAAGYVVLTYDVQGQGESETFGHDPVTGLIACRVPATTAVQAPLPMLRETGECGGQPSEQVATFAWGAVDAHNFFTSAANPWADRIDLGRIGAAGHSWGASAVSTLQALPVGAGPQFAVHVPVRAIVGWDWVEACAQDRPEHTAACPDGVTLPARAPMLDVEGDFDTFPLPFGWRSPDERLSAQRVWESAGTDAATLVLRAGTHFDFVGDWWGLPASRDGQALTARATVSFLDAELRADPTGPARLRADHFDLARTDPLGQAQVRSGVDRRASLSDDLTSVATFGHVRTVLGGP